MNKLGPETLMKHLLTIALASGALLASAQNSAVVNAYNYMKDGELDKAAEYIEPATTHEATMAKDKTWRYRGDIYRLIAMGDDAALKAKYPDALKKAIDSYLKAVELDTKDSYKADNVKALGALQGASLNAGNDAFGAKEFDRAIELYGNSQRIAKAFGMVDTNAIFNTALAYETKGDAANAVAKYKECIDLGYDKVEVYRYLATLQAKQEDLKGAVATTQAGRAKYPGNADLLKDELIFLLRDGREGEVEGVLNEAIEKNPKDPILWSIRGSIWDKCANPEDGATVEETAMIECYNKAEEAYKKAIELKPDFFDAYFNIGVLHNNRAAYEYEKCNKIKVDKDYMVCKEGADKIYTAAIPYFEKAHELEPGDMQTVQQLMKLYAKTNDQEKYKKMKDLLGK